MRPEHEPKGDPCVKCGKPARTHRKRPEHESKGDPCTQCGKPAQFHRKRHRDRLRYYIEYDIKRGNRTIYYQEYEQNREPRKDLRRRSKINDRIIGVDGEGQGRFPHRYTFLAGADENGLTWSVHNPDGLSTIQCLKFLVETLPANCLVVGFAFQYDLTKILKDLSDEHLYMLFHEEKRACITDNGFIRYKPVKWRGFSINYMNRRFSVSKGNRTITIWDIWRFFQGKFTTALKEWKIGSPERIAAMERMKDLRSEFDRLTEDEVHQYCFEECRHLATLTRSLITAHDDVGLKLKTFFGAGSTATALLTKMSVKDKLVPPPKEMIYAIACAFFGGRFENSWVGPIHGTIYNADISSAYPYQITLLPCLLHGRWRHVSNPRINDIIEATLALVCWRLPPIDRRLPWGPFPLRSSDGTITFPIAAKGGWCWKKEYLAGLKFAPNVECTEAWLYHTDCDCRPFKDVPLYYIERCKLGKENKGKILKLGPNSIYGKLAQSKGLNPPFQNWVYAGNITSGTRAQLLEGMTGVKDRWDVLALATDGISSRVPLILPEPIDTDTAATGKPLGGWECPPEKQYQSGVFCVRPGISFPLNPTSEQLKEVKARGLGKRIIYEQWPKIVEQWDKYRDTKPLIVDNQTRFVGAKSALSYGKLSGVKRSPNYGEWVPHQTKVSFSPRPKRDKILSDNRLSPWRYLDWESCPYDPALMSKESRELLRLKMVLEEQPEADLTDTELDGYEEET